MSDAHVTAVLAVKHLRDAKTRLASTFDADTRGELVLAMMSDTIATAFAAGIDDVVVVTPDESVAEVARTAGARRINDGLVQSPSDDPLNAAFRRGIAAARAAHPRGGIAVVQADLPAATPQSLRTALDEAQPHQRAFVADRAGVGTTLLILRCAHDTHTAFGGNSARAHSLSGATDLIGDTDVWADLRADVDTVDDLDAALSLGLGTHTRALLTRHSGAFPSARVSRRTSHAGFIETVAPK